MPQNKRRILRHREIVFFVGLGLILTSCGSQPADTPTILPPTTPLPSSTSQQNTTTKTPTFTLTSFPTLTHTITPTGTPPPKDTWISLGPEGGEVESLVIDPSTPTTIYARTRNAGIFKSTNGGEAWNAANTGLTDVWIGGLFMDPFSSSTLYALGDRIYKSTNGGLTWTEVPTIPLNPRISTLAIDPVTPSTLYVITQEKKWIKSLNGGLSWTTVSNSLTKQGVVCKYYYHFPSID
jgi:hypothetical protein